MREATSIASTSHIVPLGSRAFQNAGSNELSTASSSFES
jgi:hypothetical protein